MLSVSDGRTYGCMQGILETALLFRYRFGFFEQVFVYCNYADTKILFYIILKIARHAMNRRSIYVIFNIFFRFLIYNHLQDQIMIILIYVSSACKFFLLNCCGPGSIYLLSGPGS